MSMRVRTDKQMAEGLRAKMPHQKPKAIREPSIIGTVPTSANTGGEPFLTVLFETINDAENALNRIESKGYEEVIISGIKNNKDYFFSSFEDLRNEWESNLDRFDVIGLGVKPVDDVHTEKIKKVWNDNNAIWQSS